MRINVSKTGLCAIGLLVLGYSLGGRGFAYFGYPPLFIGEMVLMVALACFTVLAVSGSLPRVPLLYLLLIFELWGAIRTLPYVGPYGFSAFRDAVLWAYSLFSILTATFLIRTGWVHEAMEKYGRLIPLYLVIAFMVVMTVWLALPSIPLWPGSGMYMIHIKSADACVQLAGVAVFIFLRLGQVGRPVRSVIPPNIREWMIWGMWFMCFSVTAPVNRGGMVSLAFAFLVTFIFYRPNKKIINMGLMIVALLTVFVLADLKLQMARRSISVDQVMANIESLFEPKDESAGELGGTVEWRLEWWTKIIDYTIHGPYLWNGKGYGINLAIDDGFRGGSIGLRSPHSAHFNFLARGGVPGLALWIVLQTSFAFLLVRSHLRARRRGHDWWAKLFVWVLAFWSAHLMNSSFDVYLEGPQGGIWFWVLFGFGLGAVEIYQRSRVPVRERIAQPHSLPAAQGLTP